MKYTTKLSALAAITAFLASSAVFADDPQLQNRLEIRRAQIQQKTTTVAVYANRRALDRSMVQRNEPVTKNTVTVHLGRGETVESTPSNR